VRDEDYFAVPRVLDDVARKFGNRGDDKRHVGRGKPHLRSDASAFLASVDYVAMGRDREPDLI
jgi:hypothetical protein